MKYEPLSGRAVKSIIAYDKKYHKGINRNRFYTWLIQVGQDIQIRHVAVKSYHKTDRRVVKEVVRFSVDDNHMQIKDLVFYHSGGGYSVDWRPEGVDRHYRPYDYEGQWETDQYRKDGLWHIHATVINLDVLKRSKRFRYCNWSYDCGDIVHYLKTYLDYPGIEMLSKMGLANWTQNPSIYKKCDKDRTFAKFLFRNAAEIRGCHYTIPLVLRAYRLGRTMRDLLDEQSKKQSEQIKVDDDSIRKVADQWSWLEGLGRKYKIVLPRKASDLVDEGTNLQHCVLEHHYARRIVKGSSIIAFIREQSKIDTPFVTVEYDLKSSKVIQCYGHRNSKPDKAVQSFVDRSFAHAKQIAIKQYAA